MTEVFAFVLGFVVAGVVFRFLSTAKPDAPDPDGIRREAERLRSASGEAAQTLAQAVDARMDAAIEVAKYASESAAEGERLAALAERLRADAENFREKMDSIRRIFSNTGVDSLEKDD